MLMVVFFYLSGVLYLAYVALECRKVAVINLDPANDSLPYPFHFLFRKVKSYSSIGASLFRCIVQSLSFL